MIAYRSREEISNNISKSLIRNVGISARESGTLIKTLVDALSLEIERSYDNIGELVSNTYLSEASGPYLDMLGNFFGVERLLPGEKTHIDGIRFYTKDGKPLKNYIKTSFFNDITVTSPRLGGKVSVSAVVDSVKLEKGYIDLSGTIIESGNGQFPVGSLSNYSPAKASIAVTNVIETNLVVDGESDNSFRNRISKAMSGKRFGTAESIFLAGYAIPGIADIIIDEKHVKPGTIDIYVVPNDLTSTTAAAKSVKNAILGVIPKGVLVNVYPAEIIFVYPDIEINATGINEALVKNELKNYLKLSVDNLKVGESIDVNIMNAILSGYQNANITGYKTNAVQLSKKDKYGYTFQIAAERYTLSEKEKFSIHPETPLKLTVKE